MNLPRLDLQQTYTKIGWDVQPHNYTFEPAKTELQITQHPAEMTLNRTPSRLTIDQSECWADMDLKPISRWIAEAAADGKQEALAYIERVTAEGEELGAIENKSDVVRSIAMSKRVTPHHSFQYGNVPRNFSLHIDFTPGELNMDWQTHDVQFNVQSTPYQHDYKPAKISYYVQQKNQLEIQVVGGAVDTSY